MRKNKVEDLERELVGYMPQSFVLMYYDLVEKGHAQYTSPLGHPGEGGQQTGRRYIEHDGGLRDEAALSVKRKIDRTLRQIVRDIDKGSRSERPTCTGCHKFGELGWTYCAWCGAKMRGAEADVMTPTEVAQQYVPLSPQKPIQRPELR